MLHLAGSDPAPQALEELRIFKQEGIDGAIIENYHGSIDDVIKTLEAISKIKTNVILGVNILPNHFEYAFLFAQKYGAQFVQLDYVAGTYLEGSIDYDLLYQTRKKFPNILVLGGVHPKYYTPILSSNLKTDLGNGMQNADAIVVTGEATGKETPLEKIQYFKQTLRNFPVIVGAGLTPHNTYEQLRIADGAIVGSCLKPHNNTEQPVDAPLIRELMNVVYRVREEHKK